MGWNEESEQTWSGLDRSSRLSSDLLTQLQNKGAGLDNTERHFLSFYGAMKDKLEIAV